MRLHGFQTPRLPATVSWGHPISPRFSSEASDEFGLSAYFKPKDPFLGSRLYVKLKSAVLAFEHLDETSLTVVRHVVDKLQSHPLMTARHHGELGRLLYRAALQLEQAQMFLREPSKPINYRLGRAAKGAEAIIQLGELVQAPEWGYRDLRNYWLLALSSNTDNEMAGFAGMWGALLLPTGKTRDLIIAQSLQNPSHRVRRLAALGAASMQSDTLQEAVLYRMSSDTDRLIRWRASLLKDPKGVMNWALGWALLRKPKY